MPIRITFFFSIKNLLLKNYWVDHVFFSSPFPFCLSLLVPCTFVATSTIRKIPFVYLRKLQVSTSRRTTSSVAQMARSWGVKTTSILVSEIYQR